MMSKKEVFWFCLFLLGMALLAVERGWKAVCWNVGVGIIGWVTGHVLRGRK